MFYAETLNSGRLLPHLSMVKGSDNADFKEISESNMGNWGTIRL